MKGGFLDPLSIWRAHCQMGGGEGLVLGIRHEF